MDTIPLINLLPWRKQQLEQQRRYFIYILAISLAVQVLLLTIFTIVIHCVIDIKTAQLLRLQQATSHFASDHQNYLLFINQQQQLYAAKQLNQQMQTQFNVIKNLIEQFQILKLANCGMIDTLSWSNNQFLLSGNATLSCVNEIKNYVNSSNNKFKTVNFTINNIKLDNTQAENFHSRLYFSIQINF